MFKATKQRAKARKVSQSRGRRGKLFKEKLFKELGKGSGLVLVASLVSSSSLVSGASL